MSKMLNMYDQALAQLVEATRVGAGLYPTNVAGCGAPSYGCADDPCTEKTIERYAGGLARAVADLRGVPGGQPDQKSYQLAADMLRSTLGGSGQPPPIQCGVAVFKNPTALSGTATYSASTGFTLGANAQASLELKPNVPFIPERLQFTGLVVGQNELTVNGLSANGTNIWPNGQNEAIPADLFAAYDLVTVPIDAGVVTNQSPLTLLVTNNSGNSITFACVMIGKYIRG